MGNVSNTDKKQFTNDRNEWWCGFISNNSRLNSEFPYKEEDYNKILSLHSATFISFYLKRQKMNEF